MSFWFLGKNNRHICLAIIFVAFITQNHSAFAFSEESKQTNNAEIIFTRTSIQRKSVEKYTIKKHLKALILNKKGAETLMLVIVYDKHSRVNFHNGFIQPVTQKNTIDIKEKDFQDQVAKPDFVFFSDTRAKFYIPYSKSYPCVLEYEYEIEYTGFLAFETWYPIPDDNIYVEQAVLEYSSSVENDILVKQLNFPFDSKQYVQNNIYHYEWKGSKMQATEDIAYLPPAIEKEPCIFITPKEVQYEHTHGDFSSWNSFGKWVYSLIEDNNKLPAELIQKAQEITRNAQTDIEKIRLIYQYLQNSTRYVCIDLGIGGFQPMSIKEVQKKRYGDCKALTNYTKALLKAVNIESYYAVVGNGPNCIIEFPDYMHLSQTNHAILLIPLANDSLWLECTSSYFPAGYLGSSTANRFALITSEVGGTLIKTKNFGKINNEQHTVLNLMFDELGECDLEFQVKLTGIFYEKYSNYKGQQIREQTENFEEQIEMSGLSNFQLAESLIDEQEPIIKLKGSSNANNLMQKSGDLIILKLKYLLSNSPLKSINSKREEPVFLQENLNYIDSIFISLPKNRVLKNIPEKSHFKSQFGEYSLEYKLQDGRLLIIRNLAIHQGEYLKNEFENLNKLVNKIGNNELILVLQKQ